MCKTRKSGLIELLSRYIDNDSFPDEQVFPEGYYEDDDLDKVHAYAKHELARTILSRIYRGIAV